MILKKASWIRSSWCALIITEFTQKSSADKSHDILVMFDYMTAGK